MPSSVLSEPQASLYNRTSHQRGAGGSSVSSTGLVAAAGLEPRRTAQGLGLCCRQTGSASLVSLCTVVSSVAAKVLGNTLIMN